MPRSVRGANWGKRGSGYALLGMKGRPYQGKWRFEPLIGEGEVVILGRRPLCKEALVSAVRRVVRSGKSEEIAYIAIDRCRGLQLLLEGSLTLADLKKGVEHVGHSNEVTLRIDGENRRLTIVKDARSLLTVCDDDGNVL